jgi:hypothetical protein
MVKRIVVLGLLQVILGCGTEVPSSNAGTTATPGSALDGAWMVAEITTTGPDSATLNIRSPQPGYLLFTGRYYSLMRITSAEPRPALEPVDARTVEGLNAVWGTPFTANAGTYEMAGETITFTPLVAKNPQVMAPGNQTRSSVRILGDSLWATGIPADTVTVPNPNPLTFKYVRVR